MGSRYDEKDIQLDGSLIQGGAHDRYEVDNGQGKSVSEVDDEPVTSGDDRHADAVTYRYNWLHDTLNIRSSKRGLRFDRSQHICSGLEGNTWPFHGTMEKNVVWNTAGVMAKGNDHDVVRNTVFDTGSGHGGTTDDEGSTLADFSMYHWDHTGTCQCVDPNNSPKDYCVNSEVHSHDEATEMCVRRPSTLLLRHSRVIHAPRAFVRRSLTRVGALSQVLRRRRRRDIRGQAQPSGEERLRGLQLPEHKPG